MTTSRIILEIFAEAQRRVWKGELEADLREDPRMRIERGRRGRPPGSGAAPNQALDRGRWIDQFAERFFPPERLPRGLDRYDLIEKGQKIGQIDRLDRKNGVIYEIKPDTEAEKGARQLQKYAQHMNKHEPLPNGQKWKVKLLVYPAERARQLLELPPGANRVLSIANVGVGLAHGFLQAGAIRKRAEKEGYVPYGANGFANESRAETFARWLLDPTLGGGVPIEQRFNIAVWRHNVAEKAAAKKEGDRFRMNWQVQVGTEQFYPNNPIIKDVLVVYKKLSNGKWMALASESDEWPPNAPAKYSPDLNQIIDPKVSHDQVKDLLFHPAGPRA